MIFEIIRGGGGELTWWGNNGPAYFFPGERLGRPAGCFPAEKNLLGGNSGLLHRVGDSHFVNNRYLAEISPERYYEEFWVNVTS